MTNQHEDKTSRQPGSEQCWKSIGVMGDATCPKLEEAVHCRNCPVFAEAGQELFERQPPAEYIEEQTLLLSEKAEYESVDSEAMIVFRVGEEWLAMDVDALVEVAQPRTIHRVPHRSDRLLMGIVNIRGELQLCVSLRKLLRIAEDGPTPGSDSESSLEAGPTSSRLLVCERDGQRWAFAVDEVSGVHRIGINQLGNVPSTVAKSVKRVANAVFKWKEESVGRLDRDRLFDSLEGGIG